MYAQKIEGDSWLGDKIDQSKIQKMSGEFPSSSCLLCYDFSHALLTSMNR